MRRILVIMDALQVDTNTVDFACFTAALTKSKLTGIFLEDALNAELMTSEEMNKNAERNMHFFQQACERRGVQANAHCKRGIPVEEAVKESRFADIMIMNASISFKKRTEGTPSGFVKEVLANAECPVILSPESFEAIDEIVFTYNSSRSSVFAIRQFTYLFPELHGKKITLLEVNRENETDIRAKFKITEWLNVYYRDINFKLLNGHSDEELFKHLFDKKDILLVMGAYGRGVLSSLFKPSHAELIVKTTTFPVLITHH